MIRKRWMSMLPVAAVGGVLALWVARVRQEQALEPLWRELRTALAGEAVLVPSALLPGRGAAWEAVDDSTARVRMTVGGEPIVTTLRIGADGRLLHASIRRWRDAASGYVRFDVKLSGERTFGGYTVPTHLRAGWRLGEPDEFPFFDAILDTVEYR